MDTTAGNPEKQHRGRGQELSSQVTRPVKLIINPKHSCLLSLVTMAAGCLGFCRLLFGWFIVSKAVTVCVCVTTRSEVKQARGQSHDCSTSSRRVIDDDNLARVRGHSSSRSRRTQTGIESTEVPTAWYMTWGEGHIYRSTGVRARTEISRRQISWSCQDSVSLLRATSPRLKRSHGCVYILSFEASQRVPRWRPAHKRSQTSQRQLSVFMLRD